MGEDILCPVSKPQCDHGLVAGNRRSDPHDRIPSFYCAHSATRISGRAHAGSAFFAFEELRDTPNSESSNCGGDGLAISNPRSIANMVRPRIKEYFSLRVRFGVGVEFSRVVVGGKTFSNNRFFERFHYVFWIRGICFFASLILANDSCHGQ